MAWWCVSRVFFIQMSYVWYYSTWPDISPSPKLPRRDGNHGNHIPRIICFHFHQNLPPMRAWYIRHLPIRTLTRTAYQVSPRTYTYTYCIPGISLYIHWHVLCTRHLECTLARTVDLASPSTYTHRFLFLSLRIYLYLECRSFLDLWHSLGQLETLLCTRMCSRQM